MVCAARAHQYYTQTELWSSADMGPIGMVQPLYLSSSPDEYICPPSWRMLQKSFKVRDEYCRLDIIFTAGEARHLLL
jgi:hypothetical protein